MSLSDIPLFRFGRIPGCWWIQRSGFGRILLKWQAACIVHVNRSKTFTHRQIIVFIFSLRWLGFSIMFIIVFHHSGYLLKAST
mmetsp:Transcript_15201/g.51252  ORF Transcript_15201/g.51252 Transcript_15201/m.51252 type:complete len:83 (-) Transcript_15201:21-269(-)